MYARTRLPLFLRLRISENSLTQLINTSIQTLWNTIVLCPFHFFSILWGFNEFLSSSGLVVVFGFVTSMNFNGTESERIEFELHCDDDNHLGSTKIARASSLVSVS